MLSGAKFLRALYPSLFFVFVPVSISYIIVTALVNELLRFTMDKPNSVCHICNLPETPQAEWCAKQTTLIFLLPSPICAHNKTHRDAVLQSCTAGARQDPWWLCCPEEGVEDCGIQQEAENVVITIYFSWLSVHYLLAKILLELFSKYIYWICLNEPSVFFELKETSFKVTLEHVSITFKNWTYLSWKLWLKFSAAVKLRSERCFLEGFGSILAKGNSIRRCTLVLMELSLYLLVLLLPKRSWQASKCHGTICRGKLHLILVEDGYLLLAHPDSSRYWEVFVSFISIHKMQPWIMENS